MPLHVEHVSHRYGPVAALDGIDLDIADGETVALIGPSGCGKSTLLGILGGLLQPSAGRVALSGPPPTDSLNPFTYIFQDFALLPWRSVEANVALALEHRALSAAERRERVASALALTGLTEFAAAYPKQLSGGMRQRVGIARALVVRPAVGPTGSPGPRSAGADRPGCQAGCSCRSPTGRSAQPSRRQRCRGRSSPAR